MAQAPVLYLFKSNRDITITSLRGYSIAFKKGEPTHVPKAMHNEVIERGILPVDEDGNMDPTKLDEIGEATDNKITLKLAPETQEDRNAALRQVFTSLVKANRSGDFTAGGVPSAAVVSNVLGWRVDQKEIRPVWNDFKAETVKG